MSNLYVRVFTRFYSHRKTARLRGLIGDDAFWIPPRLWAYAAENQPDGNLSDYSSEEIANLIGCPKYATSILQALKDVGFIDPCGLIHDWKEYNGYHESFSRRAKTAALARWSKEKSPTPPKEDGKRKEESGDKHCSSIAPSIASKKKAMNIEEVKAFCSELGIVNDAEWFWHKCEGNGWLNAGKPIKDWRATLRAWKAGGYLPSQKRPKTFSEQKAEESKLRRAEAEKRELDRIGRDIMPELNGFKP